jgi:archaellum component FlaC
MTPEAQKEAQSAYQTEMQKVNAQVGALNMGTSGVTQLLQGIGSFVNTVFQAEAKETEAKSAEDSADAQQLQSYSDQSQKISQDLGKLADQIIAILKEINDAKAQMMQTMTRV